MLLDKNLVFAKNQAVTASAASATIVDNQNARNIGVGERLFLVVLCTAAMASGGGAETVTPSLRTSATQAAGALSGTINTILTLPAFAHTSPAGTQVVAPLPPGNYLEYLDVEFTVAGGPLTAGTFTAFIVKDADLQQSYPAGYTIS